MVNREGKDTTTGNTGGGILKRLSNEVVFGFFNDEKTTNVVQGVYDLATKSEDENIRLKASQEIFDRILGKPVQPTDLTSGGEKLGNTLDVSKLNNEQLGTLAGIIKSLNNKQGTE